MNSDQVRIQMNEEEWWPVFDIWEIDEEQPRSLVISRELFDRYRRLQAEFRQALDELGEIDTKDVSERIQEEFGEREFRRTVSENPNLPLTRTSQDV